MFSFSFGLVLFVTFGVCVCSINFNTFDKASLFGQFQNLLDNPSREELSCFRIRANIKNPHPTDNTKYYICRDENRYEIFTCPNGGIFNDTQKACIDLCEQTKPCLNQGQCIILSNLTLQCVCRRDWTGERCETPLSSCVSNPCGANAECRMLQAKDYPQDYVCICNNHQTYGRNCQQTVPNPCLANIQQFHPFAYSRRAYINCDGEVIFFQPCNALLYWNQEAKRCDRSLPDLLRSPFMNVAKKPDVRTNQWQSSTSMQQNVNNQLVQQQNFPTFSNGVRNVQWSNIGQNQPSFMNSFTATSTPAPTIFHLQGFGSRTFPDQQSNQLRPPFLTTTPTVPNTGLFIRPLRGWQQKS